MPPADPSPMQDAPRPSFLSSLALVLATLPLVAWGVCASGAVDAERDEGAIALWIGACILSVLGSILGFINALRLSGQRPRRITGAGTAWWAFLLGILSPFASLILGFLTLDLNFSRGRALRRGGRARLPAQGKDMGWVESLGVELDAPAAAATAWRANAATEVASVPAFSHLSNELLALGAPTHLIEKAHADALDEIRHARLCYGLAAAMDGQALGPASFPAAVKPRDGHLDFAALAAECIVESCVLESASARVAAALAAHPDLPEEIRTVLDTITVDEARHAAHGWEILSWCREAGGASIDAAMRQALSRVVVASATAPVDHDELERWGIAGPALWRRCIAEALADVQVRLSDASDRSLAA